MGKTILVWTPARPPYVACQPQFVYLFMRFMHLYAIKKCLYVLHLHVVYVTFILKKGSHCSCVRVCYCGVCVCLFVGCCGWAGWGRGPWCGCLCVTSTHGDGGMRLNASPRMSGNLLRVCVYFWGQRACVCARCRISDGPTWPYWSLSSIFMYQEQRPGNLLQWLVTAIMCISLLVFRY